MINIIKSNWKDVLTRAGKTFMQAFLGSICLDSVLSIRDTTMLKSVLVSIAVGGISAGISAVWNLLMDYTTEQMEG